MSVSDKSGIVQFAQGLVSLGFKIVSTGGTLNVLKENGIEAISIDEVTGFPEMLDGRVKTLHPKIHGGLLARRDKESHMDTCEKHDIGLIDLVVVNLYPFEATISKPDVDIEVSVENIDIGGPSMLRSASKNYQSVGVIVNPDRYQSVMSELKEMGGSLSLATKADLARDAFHHTARYDSLIAGFFDDRIVKDLATSDDLFPSVLTPVLTKSSSLRYGENPHQQAAYYTLFNSSGLSAMEQHHGKPLSFNNIADIDMAWKISNAFDLPGAVVIKHMNPCGSAQSETLVDAYKRAYEADSVSAFGSIVGLNREVDAATANEISRLFVEVVVAPSFSSEALDVLTQKQNIRLISLPAYDVTSSGLQFKYVSGGFLVQEDDKFQVQKSDCEVVTDTEPTPQQWNDLLFGYSVVKYVKSNAILLAKDGQTIGVGAGQMSRVDSVDISLQKAGDKALGSALASDAFFPFRDSIDLIAKSGVTAVIQPGGSKRDEEVIDACNEHGIAMVFTGKRHFLH